MLRYSVTAMVLEPGISRCVCWPGPRARALCARRETQAVWSASLAALASARTGEDPAVPRSVLVVRVGSGCRRAFSAGLGPCSVRQEASPRRSVRLF